MYTFVSSLLTVNGEHFDLSESIRRSMLYSEQFIESRVSELLIRQYAAEHGIVNSLEELQMALDELRYQKGLETAENFHSWLKSGHQTPLSLQNAIDYQQLRDKVRASLQIELYFANNQRVFDQVDLYSLRVDTQAKAEELYAAITEDGKDFYLLAMEHSLDEVSRPKAGYIGRMYRHEVAPEIEAVVFTAQPGEVIGPIQTEKGYNLFKVSAVYPAELDRERENIRSRLFDNLLERLRAEAEIIYSVCEEKL